MAPCVLNGRHQFGRSPGKLCLRYLREGMGVNCMLGRTIVVIVSTIINVAVAVPVAAIVGVARGVYGQGMHQPFIPDGVGVRWRSRDQRELR